MLRQVALSAFHRADQTPLSREVRLAGSGLRTFATNQTFLSNSNTYKFSVTVSTTRLEFCLPLMGRPVPVERVLHLRVPAVLLEDVLLLELVLLLGNNSGQFEEQPDMVNIVSWEALPCWAGVQ